MISPPVALGPATGLTPYLATPYRDTEEYCFQNNVGSAIKDKEVIAELLDQRPAIKSCAIGVAAFVSFVESMLKDLLVSAIQPVIDHINENGSYAILKVAN